MMRTSTRLVLTVSAIGAICATAAAQSSSLYRRQVTANAADEAAAPAMSGATSTESWAPGARIEWVPPATRTLQQHSLIAVSPTTPRPIKVDDQVTIIVREQKKYTSDAELQTKKDWKLDADVSKWLRFYPGHKLGADNLSNGDPAISAKWKNDVKNEADAERQDKFETRISGTIIDVKPNGTFVIEAKKFEKHDEETIVLSVTGTGRAADITADNTILSTQLSNLQLQETHTGAVRDGTRRGWIPKLIDFLRPF